MSASGMMRAVIAHKPGGPEVLELLDLPIPNPAPGELRIRVLACGLNPLDLMARRGTAPWFVKHWPVTLGIEHGGTVDAVGEGVDPSWIGRAVTSTTVLGGNADYSCVPLSSVAPMPHGLDAATAILYRGASHTAWRILEMFGPAAGSAEWVLVHSAAGTVGPMLTQIAKSRGLRVCGIVGSQRKADFASSFGLDAVVVADGSEWVGPAQAIMGAGAALAVDGVGGEGALGNIDIMAPLGTCLFIGASSGVQVPAIEPRRLIQNSIRIAGFNLPQVEALEGDVPRVDNAVIEMLRSGSLRLPVTHEAQLDDIYDLHRAFEARELMGRTLIRIADTGR
ncbi:MAG: zinc-binding dehydrogenase [Sphingobium sp.]